MDNKNEISRIKFALKKIGMSMPEFQRALGIQSQHWNNWKKRGIPGRRITEIATILNVSSDWLVTGEHKTISETEHYHHVSEPTPGYQRRVPLIDWTHARHWPESTTSINQQTQPCPCAAGPRAYALEIKGDSMINPYGAPSLPEGYIIIVDPDIQPAEGDLVIAQLDETPEATCKKLIIDAGRRYLKPLNPAFPIITLNNHKNLLGKVIWLQYDLQRSRSNN